MSKGPTANVEATDADLYPIVQQNPKRKWQSYLWDSLDKSPEERHFIFKLDLALLVLGCLGFFIKFLDQANVVNAFVSGMKEDLGMFGNELNYVTTAWTVGYIVGEIPSNILLTRIRPSIWLPTCELIWTILTMCLASCKNTTQLYVLRFFIGLAEGGFYPGMQYMIGSWYRKDEIAKRACILNASGSAALIFSGFLMSAVVNLDGRGGLAGWKWLFIMDGVISIPIAFASYAFLPDVPETTRAWFFSKDEVALARKRMALEGRREREPYTWAKAKRILTSWHIYGLSLLYFFNAPTGGTPVFAQYLKYHVNPKYTISQINNYPSATAAIQVVAALVYAWVSDTVLRGRRWPVIIFGATLNFVFFLSLAVWNIADGWRWACCILLGQIVGLSGISMTWANEICSDDNEERAIVLATMNQFGNIIAAWLPLIVWQQIDAPKYQKGFITGTCMSVAAVIVTAVMIPLHKREIQRKIETVEEAPIVPSRQESDVGSDRKVSRNME